MFSNQFHSFQLLGCFDLAASFFNVFTQITNVFGVVCHVAKIVFSNYNMYFTLMSQHKAKF